jgi:glutaredoxin 2
MKNPGFLINGTIVVLKPTEEDSDHNTIAVVVGRYTTVVEGYPEYVGLPIVLDSDDEETTIKYLTRNDTMASYLSFFEDEVLSQIGIVKSVEEKEWVITNTINYIRDKDESIIDKDNKVKKLEFSLEDALLEKNYTKFKWIIFNTDFHELELNNWIKKLTEKKEFYIEYFEIKEKDIDSCIQRLQKSLENINIRKK